MYEYPIYSDYPEVQSYRSKKRRQLKVPSQAAMRAFAEALRGVYGVESFDKFSVAADAMIHPRLAAAVDLVCPRARIRSGWRGAAFRFGPIGKALEYTAVSYFCFTQRRGSSDGGWSWQFSPAGLNWFHEWGKPRTKC